MITTYIFDWGDTLMLDDPQQAGKMCHWAQVTAVEGAAFTLAKLAQQHAIYIATNAAESSEQEIAVAFERVGLAQYIDGYFCRANLGIGKGSPVFFQRIAHRLGCDSASLRMVGDSYSNDIAPALAAGLDVIWFNPDALCHAEATEVRQIRHLTELLAD